jgi:hypothetical protein
MQEFPFAEGIKHLHGVLFLVPFSKISTPEEVEQTDDYKFRNPRLMTERGQADLLDRNLSASLRDSIKTKTLMNPLICRWINVDGELLPQVLGGDRRYRALEFLIRKKEMVRDPNNATLTSRGEYEFELRSADKVYEYVPCQIYSATNDLDALAISYTENHCRQNFSEGHDIAMVIELRRCGASDNKILEILSPHDEKWLRETDNLIHSLDEKSLHDLTEGRIDRDGAKALLSIEDLDLREQVRETANQESQEEHNRRVKRIQKHAERAMDEQEIAEGELADAEYRKDSDATQEATVKVAEASAKVARNIRKRVAAKPVTTVKNVRAASVRIAPDNDRLRSLRGPKIKAGVDYFTSVVVNEGKCPQGTFVLNIDSLKFGIRLLNAILAGDDDFANVARRHALAKKEEAVNIIQENPVQASYQEEDSYRDDPEKSEEDSYQDDDEVEMDDEE